ncbi:PREDICTED: golgin subfamily A member 4-like [Dufourea novaeangliae]|uniref:golgin subfamily A member 4-like n=1 Tax=Dufourea novaeangliae TaxID=178035 RepID=UPI00076725A7|nr:PREDICTED: golgin subfamily A member 4-like [Dufourea novaeangliae]
MKVLETQAEETLETDVARILLKSVNSFLNTINVTSQEVQLLDQRREIIGELRDLVEPLVEFLSCLSVVQSSRRSLVPEAALLDERRNVILKAVEGLQRQTSSTLERIPNLEGASLYEEQLNSLKNAIISVQKQIGKTDYTRRPSSVEFTLQYNLSSSLDHLRRTISSLEENVDTGVKEVVSKSLGALQKQISLSRMYFVETGSEQSVDEEAILEGFLYPTNQLQSALKSLKEKLDQKTLSSLSIQTIALLRSLAKSTSELASSLSMHRLNLIREGASEGSSFVETLSAVVDVLESVKVSIKKIEEVAVMEEKSSEEKLEEGEQNVSTDLPITIMQIETIIDEIIEVSKEEVECVQTVEKVSPEGEVKKIDKGMSETLDEMKSVSVKDTVSTQVDESGAIKKEEGAEVLSKKEEEVGNADVMSVKSGKLEQQEVKADERKEIIEEKEGTEVSSHKPKTLQKKEETAEILSGKSEEVEKTEVKAEELTKTEETTKVSPEEAEGVDKQLQKVETVKTEEKISSEQVDELVVKEGKVESLPEGVKELARAKEEVEQLPGKSEKVEIKEQRVEAVTQKAEEVTRSEESMQTSSEKRSEQSGKEETIEKSMQKVEDVPSIEESVKKTSEKAEEIQKREEIIESTSEKTVSKEESVQALPEKLEEPPKQEESKDIKLKKTITSISTIEHPFKELISLMYLALEEPLASKSEEEKRKIRELTALVQILNDLNATTTSIRHTILPSSIPDIQEQVLRILKTLVNVEQAANKVLRLTAKELTPALKENVMVSLQFLLEPLESLQHNLSIVEEFTVSTNMQELSRTISELVKVIRRTTELKHVKILEEIKVMVPMKSKEESQDIEDTTAKPLEELIEAIMVSQDQVKRDDASPFGSISPSVEPSDISEQQRSVSDDEMKLDTSLVEKIVSPIQNLRELVAKIQEQEMEETETLDLPTRKTAAAILNSIIHPLEELEQSLNISAEQQIVETHETVDATNRTVSPSQSLPVGTVLEELKRSIATIQEEVILEAIQRQPKSESKVTAREMEQSLEDLKFSVGAVQKIATIETENSEELSEVERTIAVETFVKSVKKLGEKCLAIASRTETKTKAVDTVQKEELRTVIKILKETTSEIEMQKTEEARDLDHTGKEVVEALKPLVQPLEELQQILCTVVQVGESKFESTEEFQTTGPPVETLKLTPVLEELRKSIAVIEQQASLQPQKAEMSTVSVETSVAQVLQSPLDELKLSVEAIQNLETEEAEKLTLEEKTTALKALAKCVEEIGKVCSAVTSQQKVEVSLVQQAQVAQLEQVLETITSPIQILKESTSEIETQETEETKALDQTGKEIVEALKPLVQPLEQLEQMLSTAVQQASTVKSESAEEAKEAGPSAKKIKLTPVLEELKKSIAVIEEQVSVQSQKGELSTSNVECSVAQVLESPLEVLKSSVEAMQKLETEEAKELSSEEKATTLKAFAKCVEEIGKVCSAVTSQQKVEVSLVQQAQVAQLEQVLETITSPIQILKESTSEIETQETEEAKTLDQTGKEVVEALKPLVQPLEQLEQILNIAVQQSTATKSESAEEAKDAGPPAQKMKLTPVLDELQKSIAVIEKQVSLQPQTTEVSTAKVASSVAQVIESPLEELKSSVEAMQKLETEEAKELSSEEKATTLKAFGKCVEEIGKVCSAVTSQQKIEVSLVQHPQVAELEEVLEIISSPLHVLRETMSKVEEQKMQESEALQMPQTGEMSAILNTLIHPLEELERSLSVAVEQTSIVTEESALEVKDAASLKLNVEPILQELDKSIAVIQEQISLEPIKEEADGKLGTSVVKALEEPLEQLKASIAAVQETMSTETNQTTDIPGTDKISTLKVFAKSVEELGEKCLAAVSQEQIPIQLTPTKPQQSQVDILEKTIGPLQVLRESINKIEVEKLEEVKSLTTSQVNEVEKALKILVEPLQKLETSLSSTIQQEKDVKMTIQVPSSIKLEISPAVEELQKCIITIQEQVKLQSATAESSTQTSLVQAAEKSLEALNSSLTIIQSVVAVQFTEEEKLPDTKQIATLEHFAESVQEFQEKCLAVVSQQQAETTEAVPDSTEKINAQVLETIITPVQALRETIVKIQEEKIEQEGVLESEKANVQTLAPLIHPLKELERCLMTTVQQAIGQTPEVAEELKKDSLQAMALQPVLEQLKESIVVVEEQLTITPESRTKSESIRNIKEAIEELKLTTTAVQQAVAMPTEVTEGMKNEKESALQAFAKSVEQLEERCSAVTKQEKTETQLEEPKVQKAKMVNVEILQKISNSVHVLRESFSEIVEEEMQEVEEYKIPKDQETRLKLNVLVEPLSVLEKALLAAVKEGAVISPEIIKELKHKEIPLEKLNLEPVLEELQKSITVIQQQATETTGEIGEHDLMRAAKTPLENLKVSIAAVQETVRAEKDETREIKLDEQSNLEAFAKSVEESGKELLAVAKQEVRRIAEASRENKTAQDFVRTIVTPINELQNAILKIDEQTKGSGKRKEKEAIIFLSIMQPLHQLEESFLSAMQGEQITMPTLQKLPVKSTLQDLNKHVTEIQEQLSLAKETLTLTGDTDDFSLIKNVERSISDLRTSVAVVQQLTAIEAPGQQVLEVENVSALQAFGKAIEEFKKHCTAVVSRPKVIAAITGTVEQPARAENIVLPAKILQESVSTIEEIKIQETDILEPEMKKSVTVLSVLIPPLQQLEQSFVAAIQGEHVVEHAAEALEDQVSFEATSLKPILEEFQKSLATIQEHIIEEGVQSLSEAEDASQLKMMAQTLTDLRTSVAAIQQIAEGVPEVTNELSKADNVTAFETFAKSLHDLVERVATIDHQQMIIEPAADTISEDASSLKTWADVVEESNIHVTGPMIVDQGTIDSPSEMAVSISEDEAQALKGLAKPLSELRECLALVVEERKSMDANEVTVALSEKDDLSLLKMMAQPLLELRNAAVSVIHEQTTVESAREKSFGADRRDEVTPNPLIEPLEELCNSIALIQDHMLIESTEDRPVDEVSWLTALAEPLVTLQRSISVLEERVISPDVEPIQEESNWITECLAVPLQEIERSIAEIRECIVVEPSAEEQSRIDTPDWAVVEKLVQPVEVIKSVITGMKDSSITDRVAEIEYEAVKTLIQPLTGVHESFLALKDKTDLSADEEEACIDAIVDSLSNLEKSISYIEERTAEKLQKVGLHDQRGVGIIGTLSEPLMQLKESLMTVEESSTVYLENLEQPLKHLQAALENVSVNQREKALTKKKETAIPVEEAVRVSTKIAISINEINVAISSIDRKIESYKDLLGIEVQIENEALKALTKPLEELKQAVHSVLENNEAEESSMSSLRKLQNAIGVIRQQSADKPVAEPSHSDTGDIIGMLRPLAPSLCELETSTGTVETLWRENLTGEGLVELETPIANLMDTVNILCDKLLRMERKSERKKKEKEDQLKQEEERKKREEEKLKQAEEERKQKEELEKLKQEEERKQKEEDEKLKQEEERKQKEEVEKLKLEEEQRG